MESDLSHSTVCPILAVRGTARGEARNQHGRRFVQRREQRRVVGSDERHARLEVPSRRERGALQAMLATPVRTVVDVVSRP